MHLPACCKCTDLPTFALHHSLQLPFIVVGSVVYSPFQHVLLPPSPPPALKSGPESVNDMKWGGAICKQQHSLNKIVLLQSSHQCKQDALGHTLTARQIVYACDAIVSSLRGFVVYNHYNQSVASSPASQPFRVTRKCCECDVCCIAAYPISPSFNMDNFTPVER